MTAILFSVLALTAATHEESSIGRAVAGFALPDMHGAVRRLEEWGDKKAVVVAFVGVECPLANLYVPRLKELAAQFEAQGVAFIAVDANVQDSLTEISAYAQRHELTFPILKDPSGEAAKQFSAVRTPEVFLLDADRTIRYRGRIDDQYLVGVQKPKPTRADLATAIEEVLADKPVSVAETEAAGCLIGRVRKSEGPADVTYARDIAPIVHVRCVSCHRPGEVAPFSMTDPDEVVGWAETIREVILSERMPPWSANPEYGKFKNDCRLTDEQKDLVHRWVEAGSPLGDLAEMPPLPKFVDGWQIGEPDEVFYISDEPVKVPAEGVIDYKYYVVDPGWKEDRWVQAAECRPGNRAVVHHIIAFLQDPDSKVNQSRSGIGGYAPGMPPERFPPGTAKYVKAGSKIIFQMHYTPNGTATEDRSCVGVKYADPAKVTHQASGGLAANLLFRIPPGADNHKVTSSYRFKDDLQLRSLTPHMHLRGKSFRFEADYPDGTSEILLDVPHYDFNWQLRYELAEPKAMPKGTVIRCTAHFDNSKDNLNNPDPDANVRWGDQTWEEMMIGWFSTVRPRQDVAETSED